MKDLDGCPHKADPMSLAGACLLLCVVTPAKMDWSDVGCIGLAMVNIVFFVYRAYMYRQWERRRDGLLRQLDVGGAR